MLTLHSVSGLLGQIYSCLVCQHLKNKNEMSSFSHVRTTNFVVTKRPSLKQTWVISTCNIVQNLSTNYGNASKTAPYIRKIWLCI